MLQPCYTTLQPRYTMLHHATTTLHHATPCYNHTTQDTSCQTHACAKLVLLYKSRIYNHSMRLCRCAVAAATNCAMLKFGLPAMHKLHADHASNACGCQSSHYGCEHRGCQIEMPICLGSHLLYTENGKFPITVNSGHEQDVTGS